MYTLFPIDFPISIPIPIAIYSLTSPNGFAQFTIGNLSWVHTATRNEKLGLNVRKDGLLA